MFVLDDNVQQVPDEIKSSECVICLGALTHTKPQVSLFVQNTYLN